MLKKLETHGYVVREDDGAWSATSLAHDEHGVAAVFDDDPLSEFAFPANVELA